MLSCEYIKSPLGAEPFFKGGERENQAWFVPEEDKRKVVLFRHKLAKEFKNNYYEIYYYRAEPRFSRNKSDCF